MDAGLIARLERIAAAGIRLVPTAEISSHFVFERDGCAVLVERRGAGLGTPGSPGLLVEAEGGFAALIRRGEADYFVWKGGERPAEPGEADAARRLFTELREILG